MKLQPESKKELLRIACGVSLCTAGMREGDILMVTADHGCDPSYTKTTDHTREYVPYLICGKGVKPGVDLGTRLCFGTIAHTICDYLGVDASTLDGQSVLGDILK